MTTVRAAPTSSSLRAEQPHQVQLVQGLLATAVFGTNAGISLGADVRHHGFGPTTVPAAGQVPAGGPVPDEVRRLRDAVCGRGLSRQDVARGIGVDRRSLSGYASGEINPHPERLEALRILARVTSEIEAERPGRARGVLLSQRGDGTLLDAIASGQYALAAAWRTWVARLDAHVDVRPRGAAGEPLWAAAARALADGRLTAPARTGTVRGDDTYEMDHTEASAFADEPEPDTRRRGYR